MTKDETLKQALKALELVNIEFVCNGAHHAKKDRHEVGDECPVTDRYRQAIIAIKEALAQPEQEPVAYIRLSKTGNVMACAKTGDFYKLPDKTLLYTSPQPAPVQEPVAMKFKIYKPTVPDPLRQDINNALLPWVYDQDRSSGFDATMWVTPVATLPPQRKPMTYEEIEDLYFKFSMGELKDLPEPSKPLTASRSKT